MNIILSFAIVCVCAVHVHSMRKEAPSIDDLLLGLLQNYQPLNTNNEIDVLPEPVLETDNHIDVSNLLFDSINPKSEQALELGPNVLDIDNGRDISKLFLDLISPQNEQIVKQLPSAALTTDSERDVSKLLLNSITPKEGHRVEKVQKASSKSDNKIDVSKLFLDLISPQNEQIVKQLPSTSLTTDSERDVSKLLLNSISPNARHGVEKVQRASSKSDNEIDVSKLFVDLFAPQKVVEVVPQAPSKTDNERDISNILLALFAPPNESQKQVVIEFDGNNESAAEIENSSTTDEKKKEELPAPNLTAKINELLSDVISPLERRLLDEFERGLVPLQDIMDLGADIKNSPFTDEEKSKLRMFTSYMQTTYELHSEFKSQIQLFGVNHFYEQAVTSRYHLLGEQKKRTLNILKEATEKVKAESKAIYDLILTRENQQMIKSIENKKLELSASLRAISLAAKANKAKLIDDDKFHSVKTQRLSIIEENSKLMIEALQSKALENFKKGIIRHVDKLVDIMNKLPMKITLSYMF